VGIMLNLTVLGLNFWVLYKLQKSEKILQSCNPSVKPLDHGSMQNTLKKNTLESILEVLSKVGMLMIGLSAVPGSEPFLFSFSWSFGADQCASSEGFLVTFTPRGVEVIFCDYELFSEYQPQSSHRFIPFTIREETLKLRGFILDPVRCFAVDRRVLPQEGNAPVSNEVTSAGTSTYPAVSGQLPPNEGLNRNGDFGRYQGEALRHNLMMTTPQGILVALIPTDEGRIGTGRNTLKN